MHDFTDFRNKRMNGTNCMNYTSTHLHLEVIQYNRVLYNTTYFWNLWYFGSKPLEYHGERYMDDVWA